MSKEHINYTYAHYLFCSNFGYLIIPTPELDNNKSDSASSKGTAHRLVDNENSPRNEPINGITEKTLAKPLEIQ